MNLVVSNDLTIGLSSEARARGTTIDELADALLRSIVQDRLFDAVIDDENRLPRRHCNRYAVGGHRISLSGRRVKILEAIDADEGGSIRIQRLGGYAHLWFKAIKSLIDDGTIRVDHRADDAGWRRAYYSRNK